MIDKVLALIDKIEAYVPYVEATIAPGNFFQSDNPDWVQIHKGRAGSSRNQLKIILEQARELKKELEREAAIPTVRDDVLPREGLPGHQVGHPEQD